MFFLLLLCLWLWTHICCHNTWTVVCLTWFSCGWLLILCLACRRSTRWLGIMRGNSLCAVTQMAHLPHGMYAFLPSLPRSLHHMVSFCLNKLLFQVPQVQRFREDRININIKYQRWSVICVPLAAQMNWKCLFLSRFLKRIIVLCLHFFNKLCYNNMWASCMSKFVVLRKFHLCVVCEKKKIRP